MRIRHAVDDDHDAYTRLFTELAVPEAPQSRDRFVSSMREDVLVAEDDEGIVSLVWARARGGLWHIVHLMSDPRRRRRGVGRALLLAAAARGRSLGHQRWMLNVKPENVAARALYESVGMVEVMASAVVKLGWRDVERLPAADGVVVGPVADDVDAVPALQLLPGELAAARSLPGRAFVEARRDGGLVGVAGFDAAFSGSPLFRVVDLGVARPLLAALAPHARARDDALRVYIEGQPALRDALVGVGGDVVMRVLRLEGDLP
jgi:ribosomal protein S18 acetylase RimI-like enzyme